MVARPPHGRAANITGISGLTHTPKRRSGWKLLKEAISGVRAARAVLQERE
jgi:hypothetical protein